MLYVFLCIFACFSSASTIGKIQVTESKTPQSMMESLSLVFNLIPYDSEIVSTGSVKVELLVSINGSNWNSFSTILDDWADDGLISDIYLPPGETILTLTAADYDSWTSSSFFVAQSKLSLEMLPMVRNSFIYVANDYCFSMKDQFGLSWDHSIQDLTCFTTQGEQLSSSDQFCINTKFKEFGKNILKVLCGGISYSFDVYVTKLEIKIDNFQPPTFSTDFFNISYTLIYNDSYVLSNSESNFKIKIELVESRVSGDIPCSGLVTNGTMNSSFFLGKASFSMIRILSNGRFVMVANCEGFESLTSPKFLVTNFIKNINLITLSPPIHFSYFKLELHAIGDDDRDFVRQVDIYIQFKNFFCNSYSCSAIGCYNCLPMRINETVDVLVVDKAYETKKQTLIKFYDVLPNPNAKVVIRIFDEWNQRFPYPSMHYDEFSLQIYITENDRAFYDIPCFTHNNYVERVCISPRCSNNVIVEKIPTNCYRAWWSHTYSYTNGQRIDSLGDYVYSVPFINDLNATSVVLNMTSFIRSVSLTNLTRINAFENARFLLNLTGQDNFPYIKLNDVEITSTGLTETLNLRISEGFMEFTAMFNSNGSQNITIKSTHMKEIKQMKIGVDKKLEKTFVDVKIEKILYTTESFSLNFTVGDELNNIQDCLLSEIDPTIVFIDILSSERYLLTGNKSCNNSIYTIRNIKMIHPGVYSLEIFSNSVQLKKVDFQVTVNEKIYEIELKNLTTIYKNQAFTLSLILYNAPSVIYKGKNTLRIESDKIYGQKTSEYSEGMSNFLISCESEGLITFTIMDKDNNFIKEFNLTVVSNAGKQITINSINPLPKDTSDVFEIQISFPASSQALNYELKLHSIEKSSGLRLNDSIIKKFNESVLIFSNIKILSSGKFLICVVSSDGLMGISKEQLSINNKKLNLILESRSEVASFTEIDIIAHIIGDDENHSIEDQEVLLTAANFSGSGKIMSVNGRAVFRGYFNSNGSVLLTAQIISKNITEELAIVVLNPDFKLIFEAIHPNPTLSKDFFNCTVKIIDSFTRKKMMGMEKTVNLSLIPVNGFTVSGTYLQGNPSQETINGTVKFIDLKILSSGRFQLQGSSTNSTSGLSRILGITNFIYSSNLSYPEKPYFVYDSPRFLIQAYGEDMQKYQRPIRYTQSSKNIYPSTGFVWDCNCVHYNAYFTCLGNASFTVEITDFNVFTLSTSMVSEPNPYAIVEAQYAEAYKNFPYPAISSDVFGGCSGTEELMLRLNVRGSLFPLNIGHCSPFTARAVCTSEFCSGEVLNYIYHGYYRHYSQMCYSVNILSTGDFNVFFSIPGARDGQLYENSTYKGLNITNFVKDIVMHNLNSRAVVNLGFSVMFSVYGDDSFLYIKRNNLTITSECFNQSRLVECDRGIVETELIFNQTGKCIILVKSTHSQLVTRKFEILVESNSSNVVKYLSLSSTPKTSQDIFNITFLNDSFVKSFSSAPQLKLIGKNQNNASIVCQNVSNFAQGFSFENCKILSTGEFYLTVSNLSYESNIIRVSGKVKTILTSLNKSLLAVNELFEAKPVIFAEDDSIIYNGVIIEVTNEELIGIKKIACKYQSCSFFLSCLKNVSFVLKYKIYDSENVFQSFNSNIITCINPEDDFITFEPILNIPLNTSSTFKSIIYVNSTKVSRYNNNQVQLKILKLDTLNPEPITVIKTGSLQDTRAEFTSLVFSKPGRFLLFATLSNILSFSSFTYGQELTITSPVSYIKIFQPNEISNVTNSTIEVRIFLSNNELYKEPLDVDLNITSPTLSTFKSISTGGFAKFFLNLAVGTKYSFKAFQSTYNVSVSLTDVSFTQSDKDYSLKILEVNTKEKIFYPSLSWDSSYFLVGIYDLSNSYLLDSVNGLSLNLTLNPVSKYSGSVINGQLSAVSVNGLVNFTNIFIKSLGYFNVSITCSQCKEVKSPIFEVNNFLEDMVCIGCPIDTNYSIYNKSTLFFKISADDQNVYKRPIIFIISNEVNIRIYSTKNQGEYYWYGYKLGRSGFSISFLNYNYNFKFNITHNNELPIIITESMLPTRSSDSYYIDVTLPNLFEYIWFNVSIELITQNQHTPNFTVDNTNIVKDWDVSWPWYYGTRYARFNNIMIRNNGFCYFKITWPGLNIVMTNTYNITNYVAKITLNPEVINPHGWPMFYAIIFNFNLTAEDDYPYSFDWAMNLIADGLVGRSTIDNYGYKGFFQLKLIFSTPGIKRITVRGENNQITGESEILINDEVLPSRCKLEFINGKPITSKDTFTLNFTIFDVDDRDGSIHSFEREADTSLQLITIGKSSGLVMTDKGNQRIINGAVIFENLRIFSSGPFIIESYPTIGETCRTEQFYITNFIRSIDFRASHKIQSRNFDVDLGISLTGDDGRPFLGFDILTLNYTTYNNRFMEIGGELEYNTNSSIINKTVYFKNSGIVALKINSTISGVSSATQRINILKNRFVITKITDSTTNLSPFSFRVDVCNNNGTIIESKNQIYSDIYLTVDPANRLSGELKVKNTVNGSAIFNELYASSPGSFLVFSRKQNYTDSAKLNFTILNFLDEIDIKVPKVITETVYFTVLVYLNKSRDVLFKENCSVSLISDDLYGNTTKNNTDGVIIFEVFYAKTGTKQLTARCSNIENTIEVDVIEFKTNDKLCLNPYNKTFCQFCRNKAYQENGVCKCIDFSYNDSLTDGCECISKSFEHNNICFGDERRFFRPEQLKGYFAENYKSIFIEFETRAAVQIGSSCFSQITYPEFLQSLITNCVWNSDSLIEITLNNVLLASNISIEVDGFIVYSQTNRQSFNLQKLRVDIQKKYDYPVPLAIIIAPNNISFQCNSENIEISSKVFTNNYLYSWLALTSPKRPQLEVCINSTEEYSFIIPTSLLLPTEISLYLTLTDPVFNTKSTALHYLSIAANKVLIVTFSNPGPLKKYSSDDFLIQSVVKESCGVMDNYDYSWSCINKKTNKTISLTNILLNRMRAGTLRISPNLLSPGQYTFTVNASSELIFGAKSIDIEIEQSQLSLSFSRSNGTIPVRLNVTIETEVYDPDNSSEIIQVIWSCLQNNLPCYDYHNKPMQLNYNRNYLNIPKLTLKKNVLYIFTATAKSSTKTISKSIELIGDEFIATDISLKSIEKKVNTDRELKLIPQIITSNHSTFKWIIQEKVSLPLSTAPYLTIPPNTLEPGKSYKVTLIVSTKENDFTNSSIWIQTNVNPKCSSITVNFTNNWKISANDCGDLDEDLPLMYLFGVVMNDKNIWITNTLYSNTLTTGLPSSVTQVFCKVCDDLGSCRTYYSSKFTVKRKLRADILNFLSVVRNAELVPVNILIFSEEAKTPAELQIIYDVFYDYFLGEIVSEITVDIMIECFKAITSRDDLASNDLISNASDFLVSKLTGIKFDISQENGEKIIETIKLYRKRLGNSIIIDFVSSIANFMSNYKLPPSYSEVAGMLFMVKEMGSELPGFSQTFESLTIKIPKSSNFENSTIYDIQVIAFDSFNSSVVNVKLLASGTYKGYSLKQTSLNDTSVELEQVIYLNFKGSFDENKTYECKSVETNSDVTCFVQNSKDQTLSLQVSSEATYMITEGSVDSTDSEGECSMGYYNIAILALIFGLCLGLLVTSLLIHKETEKSSDPLKISPKSLFLPSSFFFTPSKSGKSLGFLEMLSIFILILLIMNVSTMLMMKDPKNVSFDKKSLVIAVLSLAISQIYSVIVYFILRSNEFANKRPVVFSMIFGLFIFISVSLIIIFSATYCLGSSKDILKLYLIIFTMELLIELSYSFILYFLVKPYTRNTVIEEKSRDNVENSNNGTMLIDSPKKTFRMYEQPAPDIVLEDAQSIYDICDSQGDVIAEGK